MKRINVRNISRYTSYNHDGPWFKDDTLHILTRGYLNSLIFIYYPDETNKYR
jgi:hypothetical protein